VDEAVKNDSETENRYYFIAITEGLYGARGVVGA